MNQYIEIRRIDASALRQLCIKKDWYTGGTNERYSHLLFDLADNKEHITTEDIILIAQDIMEHSNIGSDYELEDIAYEVLRICNSYIRKVEKSWKVLMAAGSVKRLFMSFDNEADAERFCESNNYYWMDENEFCWDLEILEVEE